MLFTFFTYVHAVFFVLHLVYLCLFRLPTLFCWRYSSRSELEFIEEEECGSRSRICFVPTDLPINYKIIEIFTEILTKRETCDKSVNCWSKT